ncbi:hypothetical protein GCM10009347_04350 [Shewanella algicola]|nr:hypothetical protein GCM10009347_04350 [Shewanella algicola]
MRVKLIMTLMFETFTMNLIALLVTIWSLTSKIIHIISDTANLSKTSNISGIDIKGY